MHLYSVIRLVTYYNLLVDLLWGASRTNLLKFCTLVKSGGKNHFWVEIADFSTAFYAFKSSFNCYLNIGIKELCWVLVSWVANHVRRERRGFSSHGTNACLHLLLLLCQLFICA